MESLRTARDVLKLHLSTPPEKEQASKSVQFALSRARLARAAGSPWEEAQALASLGSLKASRGRIQESRQAFEEALQLYKELGDPSRELIAQAGLARAERQRGNLRSALNLYQEAIALSESLSADRVAPELRALVLSSRQEIFESMIDLLMELDSIQPAEGYDRKAFEVSEQARSRDLLDSLTGTTGGATVHPLKLREVQKLLDEDNLLLAYSLGTDRSFLWTVTREASESYVLPGKGQIEAAARQVYSALKSSRHTEARGFTERAVVPLSQMLLGPVATRLSDKSLVIVADGALQSIPFSVLTHPAGSGSEFLLVRHEITVLPSASILAAIREREGRPASLGLVAVLGDPVFSARDERISRETFPEEEREGGARATRDRDLSAFQRLPGSRQEAEILASLALAFSPAGRTLNATGFDASRELVLSGRLSGYRVLHFAAHGILDPQQPGQSGIVLSQYDRAGRPQDGVLRADEIRKLDLPADLVVLSACYTGLGADFGEDGRATLLQSFLEAGASRVIASLWDVDDRATAELMKRFYQGLFVERLPAAAALQQAQLSMMREPRWSAPYYWAGFILEGDWR
ncbi:MAG TPA: CHAT domain-containing tetratricopeptide repeat protein [Thermoanaerobaculia bacterium]|nr:CHAT domain-containing tetratricopeptide repeat protein [Thermoanaerobaculia bacterium]